MERALIAEREPETQGAAGRVFRNRNFTLLWLAQLISFAGDRGHQIALPIYVGLITGSTLQVGLLFATISLTYVILGPVAGSLVDRWDRRQVMIGADLFRFGIVLSIPTLLAVDIRLAYVSAFLVTLATLFFNPARLSLLPDLVADEELVEANSVFSITEKTMDLLGFAAAGVFVALVGAIPAFYIDSFTYLVSAALIHLIASPDRARVRRMPRLQEITTDLLSAAQFLWREPVLRANTAMFFIGPASVGVVTALTPMYSLQILGTGAWGYGLLEAAMGLGAILGGILVGRYLLRQAAGPVILSGFLLMGLATMAIGYSRSLALAAVWFALSGLGNMLFFINSISLVQRLTPADLRGRVFALRMVLIQSGLMLSAALGGALADKLSIPLVFLLAGAVLVAATALAFLSPEVRAAGRSATS